MPHSGEGRGRELISDALRKCNSLTLSMRRSWNFRPFIFIFVIAMPFRRRLLRQAPPRGFAVELLHMAPTSVGVVADEGFRGLLHLPPTSLQVKLLKR